MRVIAGSVQNKLATQVAQDLGLELIAHESATFANGERRIWVKDDVGGEDILVIQSFSHPVDQQIMEYLLLTDALERMGANSIMAVIPWLGYSLQDKVFRPGEPISAKVIADLVSNTYTKRVFLLDLHNPSIPGFFSVPTIHLSADQLMADYVQSQFDLKQILVASPDFGGLKRTRDFANLLNCEMVKIDKHRDKSTGKVTVAGVSDSVKNKQIILFDDSILSGQTVIETANFLTEKGAAEVYFFATHGLFTGNALKLIEESTIKKVVITNSIPHANLPKKLEVLSIAPIITKSLKAWS